MDISDNFLIDFYKDIPKTELIGLFGLINRKKLKKNEIFIEEGNGTVNTRRECLRVKCVWN